MMPAAQFKRYNRMPVTKTILADLDTPLSTYFKLANAPYSYLFESVQGGEKWGRYSIIGLPCHTFIKITGQIITLFEQGQCIETINTDNPLTWLAAFQAQFKTTPLPGLPIFTGGLVGYFSYDTIRYIEPRLQHCTLPDPLATPDIFLLVSENVIVFDNLYNKLHFITHIDPDEAGALEKAQAYLETLTIRLHTRVLSLPLQRKSKQRSVSERDFFSNQTYEQFEQAVKQAKYYISQGDVMQVVYSRRLTIPYTDSPLDLYRAIRCLNPSPYLYYLNLQDFYIVGSSPEILVKREGDKVMLRPIAGTRPRGKTIEEDKALENDLLQDIKELAEHLMLIDLGRNDIGRIAQTSSVQVTEKMIIERYSHVMHIVSNVIGRLKPELTAIDILRAVFPAGTLSGAPKVRAMEIIDELEPVKRGIYGGAVGYLAWNGNVDTAIAIRTAIIKDNKLSIQSGAGLVADSEPQKEWDETTNKARAMLRAVAMVQKGL